MCLAHESSRVADLLELFHHGGPSWIQIIGEVTRYAVLMSIQSGDDGRAGRLTDGTLAIGAAEANTSGGQFVKIGGLDRAVTGTPHGIMPVLVRENKNDIGFVRYS